MAYAFQDIKEKCRARIKIQRIKINVLRFADDIVFKADEKKELEDVICRMDDNYIANHKMKAIKQKTKMMVCSRDGQKEQLPINFLFLS